MKLAITMVCLAGTFALLSCKSDSTSSNNPTTPAQPSIITVTPSPVDFGSAPVASQVQHTITIRNNSSSYFVHFTAATLSGPDSAQFQIPLLSSFPVIDPTNLTSFSAYFTPGHAGVNTAYMILTVKTDSGTATIIDTLRGTGTVAAAGSICIDQSTIDFGAVVPSAGGANYVNIPVWIKNCGTSPITFTYDTTGGHVTSSITVDNSNFVITGFSRSQTRQPGDSLMITLTFAPRVAGPTSGTVTVGSPSVASPATITVTGNGDATGWPAGSSPGFMDLGTVASNQEKDTSFYVKNPLPTAVTLVNVKESPLNIITMFHNYVTNPQVIRGGDSLEVKFRIKPPGIDTYNDNLTVSFREASGYSVGMTIVGD